MGDLKVGSSKASKALGKGKGKAFADEESEDVCELDDSRYISKDSCCLKTLYI